METNQPTTENKMNANAYTVRHSHRHDPKGCNKCNSRRARYALRTVVTQDRWVLTTCEPTHCRTCMRAERANA